MIRNLLGKIILGVLSLSLFTGCELAEELRAFDSLIPEKVSREWLENLDISTLDPSLREWLESLDLSSLDPSLREWLESLDLANLGIVNSSRNNSAILPNLLPIFEEYYNNNQPNLGRTNTSSGSSSNLLIIAQPPLLPPLVPSDAPVTIREPDSIAGLFALASLPLWRKLFFSRRRF
jgi:hypothetical protein